MASATPLMTTEELLAMPDDGVERWLIRGELREKRPQEGGPPELFNEGQELTGDPHLPGFGVPAVRLFG